MIRPSCIMISRLPSAIACSILCVTISVVNPSFSTIFFVSAVTSAARCGSSAGVLVEQEDPRLGESGHEQAQRLTLTAREQPDLRLQSVLETEFQCGQFVLEVLAPRRGGSPSQPTGLTALEGQGQILLDRQVGRGAGHRV